MNNDYDSTGDNNEETIMDINHYRNPLYKYKKRRKRRKLILLE